ncbi:hypothetical protein BXY53_1428 [Dichotomicrobium thermohalophilum]|uniref:Uncharacterized protein n=1 Tax=Dichotomicrobium thermohalophilum TaxID=933063 RepID=A0A397Q924_9HYPH|nr:hypothetical protein BXY53_1428 [Dichotomicrobium thermohalophilum]
MTLRRFAPDGRKDVLGAIADFANAPGDDRAKRGAHGAKRPCNLMQGFRAVGDVKPLIRFAFANLLLGTNSDFPA